MTGSIIPRRRKDGEISWLLKYDGPADPLTGERRQHYRTVRGKKSDARRELTRLLRELDTGDYVAPDTATLKQFAEHWLVNVAPRSAKAGRTKQRYGEILRGYVFPALGERRLQKLSAPMIDKLYSDLLAAGGRDGRSLSGRTVHHVHRLLSEVLEAACRVQLLSRNPCKSVRAPRPDASPAQAFTPDEVAAILTALEGRPLAPIVRLALVTGARRGEIAGLQWGDVDHDRRALAIRRSVEKVGKTVSIKPPKTARSTRSIRLGEPDMAMLREYRAGQAETALKLGIGLTPDTFLFPDTPDRPREPMDPDRITQNFAKVLERLKLKQRGRSFHSLRHTTITLLLRGGADLKAVSQRVGHSTPTLTLNTYQHVLDDMQDAAADMASAITGGVKKPPA